VQRHLFKHYVTRLQIIVGVKDLHALAAMRVVWI